MTLHTETMIFAPGERCFDLARSVDFHAASASMIHGQAMAGCTAGLARLGDRTTWRARFFGLRFSLTTVITEFDRARRFSDVMCDGLFTHFGHVYRFRTVSSGQTLMTDDFSFQIPFGALGAIFDALVLRRRLQTVMDFRANFLKQAAESEEWRKYLDEKGMP